MILFFKTKNPENQAINRVKSIRGGEFYGLIAEGNEREILKSEFGINKRLGGSGFEFPNKATDMDIQDNYQKIIW